MGGPKTHRLLKETNPHKLQRARTQNCKDGLRRRRSNVLLDVGAIEKGIVCAGHMGTEQINLICMQRPKHAGLAAHAPIVFERFEVVTTRQFLRVLSLSSCVNSALTTRTASPGSLPLDAADRMAVKLSTSSDEVRHKVIPMSTALSTHSVVNAGTYR